MEARELRIGNVTEQGVIKSFYENGVHFGFGKCAIFSQLNPIPLTEEWLLRFGFEYDRDNLMILRKDVFEFYFDKVDKDGVNLYVKWEGIFLCGNIKYVHTLQNLYFALTGEELKLKDNGSKAD